MSWVGNPPARVRPGGLPTRRSLRPSYYRRYLTRRPQHVPLTAVGQGWVRLDSKVSTHSWVLCALVLGDPSTWCMCGLSRLLCAYLSATLISDTLCVVIETQTRPLWTISPLPLLPQTLPRCRCLSRAGDPLRGLRARCFPTPSPPPPHLFPTSSPFLGYTRGIRVDYERIPTDPSHRPTEVRSARTQAYYKHLCLFSSLSSSLPSSLSLYPSTSRLSFLSTISWCNKLMILASRILKD